MLHTNTYTVLILDRLRFRTYFCSVAMPSNKTQKNPRPNFQAINFSRETTQPGYTGTIKNLQIVLNIPQNPFLNQATPKKILSKIFLPQKNPEIGNFKPQKTLPSPLSLEIRSNLPPPPVGVGYRPRRITPSDRDLYNSSAYSKVSLIIHLESFWI